MDKQSITEMISSYHQPSSTWFIDSYEQFMEEFFRKGRFHKGVPESIVKDYELVERIMCYSYYYYPLYDEAFAKLTTIFEAAVNIRLKELNISNDPKRKFESLDEKLQKLETYTSKTTFDKWGRTRKIRNDFAHRKSGMFMGVALNHAFYSLINITNLLFIEKETLEQNESKLEYLEQKIKLYFNGPITLTHENEEHLYSSIEPVAMSLNSKRDTSLWSLKSSHTYSNSSGSDNPICIELKNVKIDHDCIKGIVYNTNKEVLITKFDHNMFNKLYPINLTERDLFIFTTGDDLTIREIITKYRPNGKK